MFYRKLKRTWSHNEANYIPNFFKVFPELKNLDGEELCDRLIELNLDFYTEEIEPVRPWIRLTMPIALLTIFFMLMGLPINFIVTGNWHYDLGENNFVYNWLKELRLIF